MQVVSPFDRFKIPCFLDFFPTCGHKKRVCEHLFAHPSYWGDSLTGLKKPRLFIRLFAIIPQPEAGCQVCLAEYIIPRIPIFQRQVEVVGRKSLAGVCPEGLPLSRFLTRIRQWGVIESIGVDIDHRDWSCFAGCLKKPC